MMQAMRDMPMKSIEGTTYTKRRMHILGTIYIMYVDAPRGVRVLDVRGEVSVVVPAVRIVAVLRPDLN